MSNNHYLLLVSKRHLSAPLFRWHDSDDSPSRL